MPLWQTNYTDK